MPVPARRVDIDVRIWLGLALSVLAGGFASMSEARADMPTYTLTFRADGTFEPTRLEVPAGRFKIVLVNESTEAVEFESLPLRKEKTEKEQLLCASNSCRLQATVLPVVIPGNIQNYPDPPSFR